MADEIKYRYCMTCRVKYKSTGEPGQTCTKCGALLADTPTGVRQPQTQAKGVGAKTITPPPPKSVAPAPIPDPVVESSTTSAEATENNKQDFDCNFGDVMLCLLHNILAGIPVLGLFWCGISVFKNPLKSRVSKGTIVAGLIANVFSAIILILLNTVLKG